MATANATSGRSGALGAPVQSVNAPLHDCSNETRFYGSGLTGDARPLYPQLDRASTGLNAAGISDHAKSRRHADSALEGEGRSHG